MCWLDYEFYIVHKTNGSTWPTGSRKVGWVLGSRRHHLKLRTSLSTSTGHQSLPAESPTMVHGVHGPRHGWNLVAKTHSTRATGQLWKIINREGRILWGEKAGLCRDARQLF